MISKPVKQKKAKNEARIMCRITMTLRKTSYLSRNSVNSIQVLCVIDLFMRNILREKIYVFSFQAKSESPTKSRVQVAESRHHNDDRVMGGIACICVKDESNYFRSLQYVITFCCIGT